MWLTLVAVRNAIAVLMAALAIVVLGGTSLKRLSIDLFPNINQPVVTVGTVYTGANVQDIEKTVTYPIEKVVSAVPGVHHVESRSRQGISVVQVWFNYDADLNAGAERHHPAHPADQQHPALGDQAAVHHPGRPLQHPRLPPDRLRGRLRRAAALRHRLQHDRAADRADQRRRGRQRGRRQDPADRGQPQPRPPVREGHLGPGRRPLRQRLELPHAVGRHQDRHHRLQHVHEQPVPARQAAWRTSSSARSATCPSGSGTSATSRTRPSSRRASSASTAQRAVYLRVNKQPSARTRSRSWTACGALLSKLDRVPPGVKVGLIFDQSTYIRQSIESLWHESVQGGRARVPGDPDLPAERPVDGDHLGRDPAVDHVHADRDVLPGPDAERLHARRAGPRASGAWSTTRSSSWRTSTATSPCRARTAARRSSTRRARWRCPSSSRPSRRSSSSCRRSSWRAQAEAPVHPADVHDLVLALRVVPGLADGDAPHVPPPAQAHAIRGSGRGCGTGSWPGARRSSTGSTARTRTPSTGRSATARSSCSACSGMFLASLALVPADRLGVLPDLGREPVPDHAPRARSAPASRRRRRWSRGSRT